MSRPRAQIELMDITRYAPSDGDNRREIVREMSDARRNSAKDVDVLVVVRHRASASVMRRERRSLATSTLFTLLVTHGWSIF